MQNENGIEADSFNLRLHRAENWWRRGMAETDADAKYIFLWVA